MQTLVNHDELKSRYDEMLREAAKERRARGFVKKVLRRGTRSVR